MNTKIWFITGCAQGIGRAIALEALKAGDRVVATARRVQDLRDLVETYGDQVKAYQLDVNVWDDCFTVMEMANTTLGHIDVLVNNAGYGLEGALEELTEAQIRQQMETNVFGLMACIKAVTPYMRSQQRGYIFNLASIAGLRGFNGMSLYNASKFAVVGLSEALAQELAPFGIQVAAVEPGPYRTNWAGKSLQKSEAMLRVKPDSPYRELNERLSRIMDTHDGKQPGDPSQIGAVLVDATRQEKLPVHMIFGDEAIESWKAVLEKYASADFLRTYPHSKRTA
ncbi:MAG: SDR family NAD(P)-dependent oxidoreductase [Bacteroidetes bacterium]|jgi:NAD(P)-dependent dehydrogenase (short-subunit alcohol dehydrogenase family)|nr:SDR family NAD(P)-dependent oxidoreductase [Bacteroidota bacterium]